jgi:putative ABC transport system permease protein
MEFIFDTPVCHMVKSCKRPHPDTYVRLRTPFALKLRLLNDLRRRLLWQTSCMSLIDRIFKELYMHGLMLNLRLALRQLRRTPGFALTVVLTLALGIGATAAIFSLVEGVLLRPLPFHDPSRLVTLGDTISGENTGCDAGVSAPEIRQYTRETSSFSALGGYKGAGYELSGRGEPAQINATRMTAGVFPALGVAPALGRVFTQQENTGHQQVAVLSYSTWQSRFHGDPNILGSKILLSRKPYEVIGVMPP